MIDYNAVERMDKMINKAVKKPLCMVKKQKNGNYCVFDVFAKRVVIKDVPFLETATNIAKNINKKRYINKREIGFVGELIRRFYKYDNDVQIHSYTLKKANKSKYFAILAKLEDSEFKLDNVSFSLLNFR